MAKILYLGVQSELIEFLENDGNSVVCTTDKIDENFILNQKKARIAKTILSIGISLYYRKKY